MSNSEINPWVRANLENYDLETLEIIPEGLREEYTRLMKERFHAKEIAALALERVYQSDQECRAFFEWVQGHGTDA